MKIIAEFVRVAWCRIVHGHLMVKLGDCSGKTLYQCARCTKTELLNRLV